MGGTTPSRERHPGNRAHAAMTEGAEGMLLSSQTKSTGMGFLPTSLGWKTVATMEGQPPFLNTYLQ